MENVRLVAVSLLSSLAAFYAPLGGTEIALFVMFAFNIFCGMRNDGISVVNCRTFSMKKFGRALVEFLIYNLINVSIFTVMVHLNSIDSAIIAVKTLTYVYCYVYLQNSFRNLIRSRPRNVTYRLIYHIIRFEFKRALPANISEIVERMEKEISKTNKTGGENENE